MALFVSWLVFPVVLGVLSLGCGLALGRAIGLRRLPGPLLLPTGFAVIVTVGALTTRWSGTAELTAPLVVALAAGGLVIARGRARVPRWALACACATVLAYGAPVLVSGSATTAGYVQLDDTATFLALTDRVLAHGVDTAGLAPSTYEATLAVNLANGYPTGALVPLGVGSQLVRSDPAWTYQPYLAYLAAMLALALYSLARSLVPSDRLRAGAAFLAAQPALLYGMAQWGGVKELFAAAVLAFTCAALPIARRGRGIVVLAVGAAALLDGLSAGAVAWLLPIVACFAVLVRRRLSYWDALGGLGLTCVLAAPALVSAPAFLRAANRASFEDPNELGNLWRPLNPLQAVGIWPAGDFRGQPSQLAITYALVALVAAAAAVGIVVAVKRWSWPPAVYFSACLAGAIAVAGHGSPWLDAKAYAAASPAVLLLAVLAGLSALGRRRGAVGLATIALIGGGVLWSNVLAYRQTSLAPRDELRELEWIGKRFAGGGPALMTEYEPYGVRHFLRRLDAEGASELRRRPVPLRTRRLLGKAEYTQLDNFDLDALAVYRTVVLRRSPIESRPPFGYDLVWEGHFYAVWQRSGLERRVLADLPLGSGTSSSGIAPCAAVRRLARSAQAGGGILAAAPERPAMTPDSSGAFAVSAAGVYAVWVGGSWTGRVRIQLDSRHLLTDRGRIEHVGQLVELGRVRLARGRHLLDVELTRSFWRPGMVTRVSPLGPLVLARVERPTSLTFVDPSRAETLCGRRFDWIEVVSRTA